MPLIALILAIPMAEIAVFVWIGGSIGTLATLFLVVGAGVLGSLVLRSSGMSMSGAVQQAMAHGRNPGPALAENALLAVAALLFIVPGFLSDLVAMVLLPRPVRRFLAERMTGVSAVRHHGGSAGSDVLDGEYEIVEGPPAALKNDTMPPAR